MLLPLPWRAELGAAKVYVELAEELRRQGRVVDHFCLTDAFPRKPRIERLTMLRFSAFPKMARAHVARVAGEYDVVDALQGTLPYSKRRLGFQGLVVVRSTGFYRFYQDWIRYARRRWPEAPRGHPLGRMLRWRKDRLSERRSAKSLRHADFVSLLNREELEYVRETLGMGAKASIIQHGLTRERFAALRPPDGSTASRLAARRVTFVGYWAARKGARDWAAIVAGIRARVPGASFSFLGTGREPSEVLADLGLPACDWIEIQPHSQTAELPALLAGATVGCLPSYVEGFPFSALEHLAAGLPVVAYDAPGAGEMLRRLDPSLLTPRGDVEAIVARLSAVPHLGRDAYRDLVARSLQVASHFTWEEIAAETVATYEARLTELERD